MTPPEPTPFWTDRPTFVTGATGLLGSATVRDLVEMDAQVICLVRDWVPRCELMMSGIADGCVIVSGDVRDQALLERVLGEYQIDTVLHLAAQTIVGIATANPVSTMETNVGGTWALLEACRRSPTVGGVVVASSDKAYGEQLSLPYTEEMPLLARHPYDATKACADIISRSYASTYNMSVAVTRCGNFYGEGDLNWNRIVPGTIRSILRNERPIIRSNGLMIRDYLYVEDGARANLALAERLSSDNQFRGQAFNFSNETPVSVLGLAGLILKLMDSDLEPVLLDRAEHEIAEQYLSAAKARDMLEWRPKFGLEAGLKRTIAWYAKFLGIAQ